MMFINVIRSSVRTQPPSVLSSPLLYVISRKACGIRFQQGAAGQNPPDSINHKMEPDQNPKDKKGDVMTQSFGEGYSTRSDEEGFGGIYGENQSLPKGEEEKIVQGKSPEYDSFDAKQGSEVKEKERARHQTRVAS